MQDGEGRLVAPWHARHKHDAGLPTAVAISGGIKGFGAAVGGECAQLGQVCGRGGNKHEVGAGGHCRKGAPWVGVWRASQHARGCRHHKRHARRISHQCRPSDSNAGSVPARLRWRSLHPAGRGGPGGQPPARRSRRCPCQRRGLQSGGAHKGQVSGQGACTASGKRQRWEGECTERAHTWCTCPSCCSSPPWKPNV